jgi:hypothetical protein
MNAVGQPNQLSAALDSTSPSIKCVPEYTNHTAVYIKVLESLVARCPIQINNTRVYPECRNVKCI